MAKKRRSKLKWSLIALVLVAGVLGGSGLAFRHFLTSKFYPGPPVAEFGEPANLAEAQMQDLEYFAHYFDLEKSYSPKALKVAKAKYESLKALAGKLTPAQFDLAIGELVGLADNGHSNVFASSRSRRFGRIDIRTSWFDDGLYVLRTTEEHEDLLGARLVSVGGVLTEDIFQTFRRYYGGTYEFEREQSAYFIEGPELLEGAGLPIIARQAVYRFEKDGEAIERVMSFGEPNPDAVRAFPAEWTLPAPKEGEGEEWKAFLDHNDQDLPAYLKMPTDPFVSGPIDGFDAYYIQLRQNYNGENIKIKDFLKKALSEIETNSPKFIILDVRHNGGGDYTTTAKAMWKLPELIPADGKIFVISSAATFSAGMSSMGFVKEKGGDRVTLVGTEPGDRMQFWSEGNYLELPNSGVLMRYSTGFVDMQNPCDDYSKCYWIGAFFPIEVESLSPEVVIPTHFSDYAAKRDPVMDWILSEIAN